MASRAMGSRATVTFDTEGMTPAMRGRLDKHLARLVHVDGEVMNYRDLYTSPGRYAAKRQSVHWVDGERPEPIYRLVYARDTDYLTAVPKVVFDAITLPDVTGEE